MAPDLQEALRDALQEVKAGRLPKQIVEQALANAAKDDAEGFLTNLDAIFSQQNAAQRLDEDQYRRLADAARALDLEDLGRRILEEGATAKPENPVLYKYLRRYLARSKDQAMFDEGQNLIEQGLGLSKQADTWEIDSAKLAENLSDFGVLMDLYERTGRVDKAIEVGAAAFEVLPTTPYVLRNYGRALEQAGRWPEALTMLRAGLWAPEYSDTEAAFLGAALSRHDDHRGSLEAYLLAAIRDADDADNFIRSAIALLVAFEQPEVDPAVRTLAEGKTLSRMIENALSCRYFDGVDAERVEFIITRATRDGFDLDPNVVEARSLPEAERVPLVERIRDAKAWHQTVQTQLTAPPDKQVADVKGSGR